MNGSASLGKIDAATRQRRRLAAVRVLLPVGWALATLGFFGPWIAHKTAGLTLSGVDMGEFVKFLPGALDGTVPVYRQLFYLPPAAICVSVALLANSRRLLLPRVVRAFAIVIAVPVSLQLLPPAWSPSSLLAPEFRLQTMVLGACWMLLAGSWLLAGLAPWLTGLLSALLSLAAFALPLWQYLTVKLPIDAVYGTPPSTGWGLPVCLVGLSIMAGTSLVFVLRAAARSREP